MFLPANITLQLGDSGDFVAELQRRLASVSAYPENQVNGVYDGLTVNGVSSFQTRSGLRADGIAGPDTLRRLNGAVTGDTSWGSSGDAAKPEETKPAAPAPGFGTQVLSPEQQLQQRLMREAQMHQQQHATGQEQLAQTLMQQTQQRPAPQPAAPQAPAVGLAPMLQQQTQANPPVQAAVQAAPVEAEPARGLVGRAMQKMDAFVQKLATYFEAKLPPDVVREVKAIGQTMLQSGVKENPIPAGPEQVRSQALPARGPEQAQAPQRG